LKTDCKICGKKLPYVSGVLQICLDCIRKYPDKARSFSTSAHKKSRGQYDLPDSPPRGRNGVKCNNCVNNCSMGEREKGFCGLRKNHKGKIYYLNHNKKDCAVGDWYNDALPTVWQTGYAPDAQLPISLTIHMLQRLNTVITIWRYSWGPAH